MALTEVELPDAATTVRRLDIAADGMIWYVNSGHGRLGRYDPKSGEIKEWPSPSGPKSHPYAIAVVNGMIWYNEFGKRPDALVRFDPATAKRSRAGRFLPAEFTPASSGTCASPATAISLFTRAAPIASFSFGSTVDDGRGNRCIPDETSQRMNARITLVAIAAIVAGTAAWSWANPGNSLEKYLPAALRSGPGDQSGKPAATARKRGPVPVQLAVAMARDIPIRLQGVGTVKARSKVDVKTRVDGQLFAAAVKDGQLVRKGDLLFSLDPRPFEVLVKQAEANLARDQANYEKAVNDLRRFKSLASKGISPKMREDDTQSQVTAMAATVRASEAALELARLNLSYSTIRSPIDGRVGNILVSPGNMVRANDFVSLLVITELSPVYVTFGLPEQHLDELRKRLAGEVLKVAVRTVDSEIETIGSLFFINNQVDSATGTIEVQARFDNRDLRLVPGQFVRASVLINELKDVVTVPTRALQINSKGHYLWVASQDQKAALRRVKVGPATEQSTAILEGLKAGESVVTDGQLRIYPGAKLLSGSDKPSKGGGKNKTGKDKTGKNKAGKSAPSEPATKPSGPKTNTSSSDQSKVKS